MYLCVKEKNSCTYSYRHPFGSLERFIGILIEHYVSNCYGYPVNVAIVTINNKFDEYAKTFIKIIKL